MKRKFYASLVGAIVVGCLLAGAGVASAAPTSLKASPQQVKCGTVDPGSLAVCNGDTDIVFTNTTSGLVQISGVEVTSEVIFGLFELRSNDFCPVSALIPAGVTCPMRVQFVPGVNTPPGRYTGKLVVSESTNNTTTSVSLSGKVP